MQPTVQHFKILGISPTSTLDEIRRAYRKLSLRYHPDKTPRREDHEKFKEINIAYETIRDYYQENGQKNSQPIPNTNTEHNTHQKPHYNTGPYSTYRFTTSSTTTDNTNHTGHSSSRFTYYNFHQKAQENNRKQDEERAAQRERLKKELFQRQQAEEAQRKKEFEQKAEFIKASLLEMRRREIERRKQQKEREQRQKEHEAKRDIRIQQLSEQDSRSNQTKEEEEVFKKARSTNSGADETGLMSDKEFDDSAYSPDYLFEENLWNKPNHPDTNHKTKKYTENVVENLDSPPNDTSAYNSSFHDETNIQNEIQIPENDEYVPQMKATSSVNNTTIPAQRRHESLSTSENKRRKFETADVGVDGLDSPVRAQPEISAKSKSPIIPDVILLLDEETETPEANAVQDNSTYIPQGSLGHEFRNILEEHPRQVKNKQNSGVAFAFPNASKNTENKLHSNFKDKDEGIIDVEAYVPDVKAATSNTTPATGQTSARSEKLPPLPTHIPNPSTMNEARPHPTTPHKRSKVIFDLKDLEQKLGNDIEDLDFKDMYESLPDHSSKATPKDDILTRSKRRLYTYTDGTSKAETLSTPMNKNPVRGHSTKKKLSMLDMHASSKIQSLLPPQPPQMSIDPSVSKQVWAKYVDAILTYQREFFNYKKVIVQYQMERINKDLEHFDDINDGSHTENLDTFKHCLEQDYLVMSEFNEALRQFGTTIATYQQNLQWVNTFMERDPNWL